MKQCPYCKGEVPTDAVKCMHCGEWLSGKPEDQSLGRAANRMVTFQIIWAVVVVALMLLFYFGVLRPRFNRFPHAPRSPFPEQIAPAVTLDGHLYRRQA